MSEQSFWLPNPPSSNMLYRNRKFGEAGKGRFKTGHYAAWIQEAGWQLKTAKLTPIEGPYELTIVLGRRKGRQLDLGNGEKAVGDLLVAHRIVPDDRHCKLLTIAQSDTEPKTRVTIRPHVPVVDEHFPQVKEAAE